jgi:signal transduction histidine kinase
MSAEKQTKLLYLLNQIDDVKAEKKSTIKDFNDTISDLQTSVNALRKELEEEASYNEQLEAKRADKS